MSRQPRLRAAVFPSLFFLLTCALLAYGQRGGGGAPGGGGGQRGAAPSRGAAPAREVPPEVTEASVPRKRKKTISIRTMGWC